MDEKIEKAFAVANYMVTLSNQRRLILEEFNQKIIYYTNGATFKVTPELINFTKTTIELGYETDVPFIDANSFPIIITDVKEFLDNIVSVYFEALNEYTNKFIGIKSKRKIADIVDL